MDKKSSSRFSVVPSRAVDDPRVMNNPDLLRVLMTLGTYSDRDGWCWPSQTTVGGRIGKSRQTVQRLISRLAELGYLEARPQLSSSGAITSNRYRILFDVDFEDPTPANQPDQKEEALEHKPTNTYDMAMLLAKVTLQDPELNKGRLLKEAKTLIDGGYDLDLVTRLYDTDGLWYRHDWRGKRNFRPTLPQIRATIAELRAIDGTGADDEGVTDAVVF